MKKLIIPAYIYFKRDGDTYKQILVVMEYKVVEDGYSAVITVKSEDLPENPDDLREDLFIAAEETLGERSIRDFEFKFYNMPKINTSKMLVVEVCSTAKVWARVYKNQRDYMKSKMLMETESLGDAGKISDRQVVRRTLKIMARIGELIGCPDYQRDQSVLMLRSDNSAEMKIVNIFV